MIPGRFLGWVLLLAAAVAGAVAHASLWARGDLLESSQFAARARSALNVPEMRDALAHELADQVVGGVPVDVSAARPQIEQRIADVIATPPFGDVYEAAVAAAHQAFLDGKGGTVRVDLTSAGQSVVDAAAQAVGVPSVSVPVPAGLAAVPVAESDEVRVVRQAARVLRAAATPAMLIAVALVGLAALVRRSPFRALGGFGVGLALTELAIFAGTTALPGALGRSTDDPDVAVIVEQSARAVLMALRSQAPAVAATAGIAGVVALALRRSVR